MLSFILGTAAFGLYFLYDINSVTRQYRLVHGFFGVGTVLLAGATVLDLLHARHAIFGIPDCVLLALAGLCFLALVYCLFFALPFQETYAEQNTGRHVYSGGVYGLCRHPGIRCFFGMELFLGLAALPEDMLMRAMVFSALNLAYAWFQDRVTFPKTFCDYDDYRKEVPFLIPTGASIRRTGKALRSADKEEERT